MKRLIPLILILALLAGCAATPAETTAPAETTLPPETTAPTETTAPALPDAPDFTMYDAEGNPVKLSDFEGMPVVLNFWASWCGPCKNEMPDFDETCKKLQGKVQFLMVNLADGTTETVEGAAAFIADAGYSFPVYYDTQLEGAALYGINSIPTTFFITPEGKVAAYYPGSMPQELLAQGIARIYAVTE